MTPADLRKRAQKAAELADALERLMAVLDSLDLPAAARKRAMEAAERLMGEAMGLLSSGGSVPGLHLAPNSATNRGSMEAATSAPKRKRGRPLVLEGPLTIAAKNSGRSIPEIAQDLGENYEAVKPYNRRRSAPAHIRARLAKPPYFVPADAWK